MDRLSRYLLPYGLEVVIGDTPVHLGFPIDGMVLAVVSRCSVAADIVVVDFVVMR